MNIVVNMLKRENFYIWEMKKWIQERKDIWLTT